MLKTKISSLILFSIMHILYAQDSTEVKNKQNLENVKKEILKIDSFLEKTEERERKILSLRLHFSELITDFATNSTRNLHFKKNREELDALENKALSWYDESLFYKNRITDLVTVLLQAKKSYQEAVKTTQSESYQELISSVDEFNNDLKKAQAKVDNHFKFLDDFIVDTKKWKKYLIDKIKKGLDNSLFKWELSPFYSNPLAAIIDFKDTMNNLHQTSMEKSYFLFVRDNYLKIIFRLFIATSMIFLLNFLGARLDTFISSNKLSHIDESIIDIIKLITSHKPIFTFATLLTLTYENLGPLTYTDYPIVPSFIFTVVVLSLFWFYMGFPVIQIFVDEINKSKKRKSNFIFRNYPLYFFIFTKSFENTFSVESDFLSLINSLLLSWISFKFFLLCLQFRIYHEKYTFKNLAVFLNSFKIFISIFAGALFVSAILELLGFSELGSSIQGIVISNIVTLVFVWIMYQALSMFLEIKISKSSKNENQKSLLEILNFFKNSLNVLMLTSFVIFVLRSWYNTIFIFGNFWDISLITVGSYRFTIDKPLTLLIGFYAFRLIYLLTLIVVDSFLLEKFKISKKQTANVVSITRYFFILIYLSFGSAVLGITYSNLIILAGALGVGIGFGLQNIVNNFISGIILLFEQPIRVGDIIEVNETFSKVKHIGIRSTIVESMDNSNIIIPNSDIISNKLTNWTLNDNIIAIRCEVGLAYGTNTELVSKLLTDVAEQNKDVLKDPSPQVWFHQFGDSSLNFVLKIWIDKPIQKHIIHSDLLHKINQVIIDNKLTIPFPQRDVHLVTERKKEIG